MTTTTPDLWIELPYGDPELGLARRMKVTPVNPEQVTVWQANGERFAALTSEWGDADRAMAGLPDDDPRVLALRRRRNEQATRTLSRALRLLKSVLADEADQDWLENQLMDGGMKLEGGAVKVFGLAVDAYQQWRGDAAPTTGPVKKATKAKLSK